MQLEKDGASYVLQSADPPHVFRGSGTKAKTSEYMLIWNAEEQAYDMLPLEFALRMSATREQPRLNGKAAQILSQTRPVQVGTPQITGPPTHDSDGGDDFGDLAEELDFDLSTPSAPPTRVVGTAGSRYDDDDDESEEE